MYCVSESSARDVSVCRPMCHPRPGSHLSAAGPHCGWLMPGSLESQTLEMNRFSTCCAHRMQRRSQRDVRGV